MGVKPNQTFFVEGSYTISVKVDDDIATDTAATEITVGDAGPTADWFIKPTVAVEGSITHFFDDSFSPIYAIVSYDWDFAGLGTSA